MRSSPCYSLESITIGSGVASIGSGAFADCDSLATVYFQGNSPTPTNDLSVFEDDFTGDCLLPARHHRLGRVV